MLEKNRKVIGWILCVLGIVAIAVGVVGYVAKSKIEADLRSPDAQLRMMFMSGEQRQNLNSIMADVSIIGPVGTVLGAVLLIIGIVILINTPNPASSLPILPRPD